MYYQHQYKLTNINIWSFEPDAFVQDTQFSNKSVVLVDYDKKQQQVQIQKPAEVWIQVSNNIREPGPGNSINLRHSGHREISNQVFNASKKTPTGAYHQPPAASDKFQSCSQRGHPKVSPLVPVTTILIYLLCRFSGDKYNFEILKPQWSDPKGCEIGVQRIIIYQTTQV